MKKDPPRQNSQNAKLGCYGLPDIMLPKEGLK
ncbi:hypothetical protein J2T16_000935 [Paenibacillus intestini]|nr:hypothetical protein [Paenibacillus intestini]